MYLLHSQAAMSRGGASCQLIQTICTISRPSIWLFPHIMYFVFGWSHFFMCWFLMVSLVWFFAIFKLKVRKYVQYQIVLQQNPQIQALNTIQYLHWPCSPGVHLGTSSPSTCRTWTSRSEPAELFIISAANRWIGEVVQSRRRPLLGPSPGWKCLIAACPFWQLHQRPNFISAYRGVNARLA